jgi:hypothetical protein
VTPKTSVGSISDTEILQLSTVADEESIVSAATPEIIDQKKAPNKPLSQTKSPVSPSKTPLQKKPSTNNIKASPKTSSDATPTIKATPAPSRANPTRTVTVRVFLHDK